VRLRTAVIIVLAVTLACYAVALVGSGGWIVPATLAVCITVPTTIATLIGVVKVSAARPAFGPMVALSATFLRMVWAVGVVALLYNRAADFGTTPTDLARWTTGFYLLTLFVETVLLWRVLSPTAGPRGAPGDGKPAEPTE
jgi:hypothetical protein